VSTSGRFFVYIMASGKNGTVYTSVAGNLIGRTYVHRNDLFDSFTRRYAVHDLVYFEQFDDPINAITREKRVKKWRREWKVNLIVRTNPQWLDRFHEIAGCIRADAEKNGFPPARE